MFTNKKVFLSITISLMVLLANYIVGNTSIPLPDEMNILQGWDKLITISGNNKDSIPNEVLLIDVAYDKQLIDYYDENDFYLGQHIITDRKKLFEFLTQAKIANNYKYIMLDVIFEKGDKSEYDQDLFRLISTMDRIVIAAHEDKRLQDEVLMPKTANADYTTTWKETNFSRYQFIHGDMASIPLKMYQEIDHNDITKWGPFYFSRGWLCRRSVTLKLPYRFTGDIKDETGMGKYNLLYLGSDLLDSCSSNDIANEIENRILVIGDFKHDIHETYAGRQPGPIINLNAYYALKHGDHILLGSAGITLIFYMFISCLYFFLSISYLNNFKVSNMIQKRWLQIVLSPVGIGFAFGLIALFAYKPLGIVYNVWIPIGVFSVLDFILKFYFTYRNRV